MKSQNASSIHDQLHDSLYPVPMRLIEHSPSQIVAESKASTFRRIISSMGFITVPLLLALWVWGSPITIQMVIKLALIALPFMIWSASPCLVADVRTIFDTSGGYFALGRKLVFGKPKIVKRPLASVKQVFVGRDLAFYRIKLELVTGDQYPLSSAFYRLLDKPRLERQADAIGRFIGIDKARSQHLGEDQGGVTSKSPDWDLILQFAVPVLMLATFFIAICAFLSF